MSGAKVALSSVPQKGIAVDGVVAVLPRDTLIVRQPVANLKTVLKGQAVVFAAGTNMDVEPSVLNEARVFAGIAESSGTKDTNTYTEAIPMVSVVRGPIGRGAAAIGLTKDSFNGVLYVKASADGRFAVAADQATSHGRLRQLVMHTSYNGVDSFGLDIEFFTIGY